MSNLADLERPRRIEPRLHEAVEDRPWYDTELDLAQSPAHSAMVIDLASVLGSLASELSLTVLSDASVWFINPGTDEQQVSFPDLAVLRPGTEVRRATAEEALFIGEVVGTQDRRMEIEDTRFQAAFSEYNDVPKFALFFAELDVVYRGELRLPVERARAEEERARAERIETELDAAKAREDELKARLRAAGLDLQAP